MKIKKLYMMSFLTAFLIFFTSCNVNNEPPVSSTDVTYSNKQTENIISNAYDKNVTIESTDISVSESMETQFTNASTAIEAKPLFSIDLNYDGVTEDFFVESSASYDEYRIVMYSDNEKTQIAAETSIDRTDEIDIYSYNFVEKGVTKHQYCVFFISGGLQKILVNLLYTGGDDCHGFLDMVFTEELNRSIRCYVHNASSSKEELDLVMTDTKKFLKESQDLEYIETIDLSQLMNISQTLKKDINICDEMNPISVYSIKNDPFGRNLKFDNSIFSYYSYDSDKIDIYKRKRHVYYGSKYESPNNHVEETDEDEYLFCLKSPENNTVELVYMGIPNENYLFSYDCYNGLSDNEHHIKEYNEILNDTQAFLSQDEWEYDKTIEL